MRLGRQGEGRGRVFSVFARLPHVPESAFSPVCHGFWGGGRHLAGRNRPPRAHRSVALSGPRNHLSPEPGSTLIRHLIEAGQNGWGSGRIAGFQGLADCDTTPCASQRHPKGLAAARVAATSKWLSRITKRRL